MASIEPPSHYSASVRRMHWTIFVLVLLAYIFINLFELFPRGSATRAFAAAPAQRTPVDHTTTVALDRAAGQ
jgi:hypothetical protein